VPTCERSEARRRRQRVPAGSWVCLRSRLRWVSDLADGSFGRTLLRRKSALRRRSVPEDVKHGLAQQGVV
jgi:hypothetical protein